MRLVNIKAVNPNSSKVTTSSLRLWSLSLQVWFQYSLVFSSCFMLKRSALEFLIQITPSESHHADFLR